jgi:C-terminal processing protease CtpA/Prc
VKIVCLLVVGLLTCGPAVGQGPSSFVSGITLVGGAESCPVFVVNVGAGSPAKQAGIKTGDVLIAVDGTRVSSLPEAGKLLHSEGPKPVALTLVRREKPYYT